MADPGTNAAIARTTWSDLRSTFGFSQVRAFRRRLLTMAGDGASREQTAYLLFNSHRYLLTLRRIDALLAPERTIDVLDLAPAPELTRILLDRNVRYHSADGGYYLDRETRPVVDSEIMLSERGTECTVRRARDVNLERDRLPFDDASMDLVLGLEVIEHLIRNPVHMLQEIARVLRPGGKLLLTTDNANHYIRLLKFLALRPIYWPYPETTFGDRHNREFLAWELEDLLRGIGYADVAVRTFNWRPFLPEQDFRKFLGYTVGNLVTAVPPFSRYRRHIVAVATRDRIVDYYPSNLFIRSAREAGIWE